MQPGRSKEKKTVLFVEDDDLVRKLNLKILQHLGYSVLQAEDGRAALELAKAFPGHIDILVTDVIMPEMNGEELSERLTAIRPGIRILFTSGYTEEIISPHGSILSGTIHFIGKPYKPAQLAAKIREVLDDT